MESSIKTYQQMHVTSLNQKELIVLLYSGALQFINRGRDLMLKKDIPGTFENLNKARNIFIHLLSTLNLEKGGEVAQKLSGLYAYFIEKITVANMTKEIGELDDIVPLFAKIKKSWENIDINNEDIPGEKKKPVTRPVQVFSAEV